MVAVCYYCIGFCCCSLGDLSPPKNNSRKIKLIRLASMSVSNSVFSRLIAINAWTIAALNIIGLLGPAIKVLDSWVVSIGQVRVSLLTLGGTFAMASPLAC